MYTQCPECKVAFRVTAEVLKMAAGKVRCGGCGVAFNALEHLSETKPSAPPPRETAPDPDLPELQPEQPAELEADTPPESISAEQSAALLKTLDQLAGEDIRIEDTGVEWRVIDDGEAQDVGESAVADDEEPAPAPPEPGTDEPSRVIDQMLFDDDTVLPDDFDDVIESPAQHRVEEPAPPPEPEAAQFDIELSEPDEWDDLLGDLEETPVAAADAVEEEEAPETAFVATDEPERPLDVDTQFEIQAEALGIDLSGVREAVKEDSGAELELELEDAAETSIDEDLMAAAFKSEATAKSLEEPAAEAAPELEDEEVEPASPEAMADDLELELNLQVDDEQEVEDDIEDIAMGFDDNVERDIETLSMSLDDEPRDTVATTAEEHVVPEMSEEEKTINMMIDQELFNIAVEDEDGFASTIVQLQPDDDVLIGGTANGDASETADEPQEESKKKDKSAAKEDEAPPELTVETIIMEGDFIGGEPDDEQPDDESAETLEAPAAAIPLNREKDDYERRREMTHTPAGAGTWAAVVALVLLLGVQFVHQSREALATVPALNSAIAPVYRMLGRPLTPQWNISGWRFEATKGDTDEAGELLTIYSRIGNNSGGPLPYPLVHVSLTDRFEDIIGSSILDPADYLPEEADPRKPVPPGSSFNAVIAIASPSPEATGFKLNVCYRLTGGQLRCADHDFK